MLEKYKAELLELFDVNDFIEMAEKYGHEEGFMINDIMVIDNFTDLLALAKKARDLRETQMYLFRNKTEETGELNRVRLKITTMPLHTIWEPL